jgi:hypothetical protein
MQKKAAPLVTAELDLAPRDELVAPRANTPVIQGRPFSARIGGSQNVQTIFRRELLLHD